MQRGNLTGKEERHDSYALIGTGEHAVLAGAASCRRFRTEIRVKGGQMRIVQCLEDLTYSADTPIVLEDMVLLKGERNKILQEFAQRIGKNHPPKTYFEMPVGNMESSSGSITRCGTA